GVIRSPEWDGPALYYAERRGDRIVVCVSGIEAIARVLSHVSDISSGGYVLTSPDGFSYINSVPGGPAILYDMGDSRVSRRRGDWYETDLSTPELGGILHKLTPATEIDSLLALILISVLPISLLLVIFALGKFAVEQRLIVRPLEVLATGLAAWPAEALKQPTTTPREIESLYRAFEDAAARTQAALSSLAEARNELATANVELEVRVDARTGELAVANRELAKSNEGLNGALDALTRVQDKLVLQEKMAALGNLAAGVAHELNTPLGAIISAASRSMNGADRSIVDCITEIRALPEDEIALFLSLLRIAIDDAAALDPDATRRRAGGLRALLAKRGLVEARNLAVLMANVGLEESLSEARALASRSDAERVLELVETITSSVRSLELVRLAAENAARVVSALRNYSWESSGAGAQPILLDRQIADVLTLLRDKLKRGISVQVDVPGDLVVLANKDRLVQVWINLVNNAIQAMGDSGNLRIKGERDGSILRLSIADDGPGIPEDIQDSIFDPFFTTKPQGEGTGIGLDICKRLVSLAGGTIGFESRPGRTVFTVELPAMNPLPEAQR
ncbi:MAG: hypothetical protein E4H20_02945, partial [Spirochaetales bacterium]